MSNSNQSDDINDENCMDSQSAPGRAHHWETFPEAQKEKTHPSSPACIPATGRQILQGTTHLMIYLQ